MDERELVGLLYRADWTRLSLAGTVRGAGPLPNTSFTRHLRTWRTAGPRSGAFPRPDPPAWLAESAAEPPGAERALVLAPGRRYRLTAAGGSHVLGCDGARAWQWFADLPPDTEVRFDPRPEPPVPELLAPAWLLVGYQLAAGEETTVAGRRGVAVTAVARTPPLRGLVGTALLPWGLVKRPERVSVVIDAEFGIVLRRELRPGSADADVLEFGSLAVGDPAEPATFAAPEGSFFGSGPRGQGPRGEGPSPRRPAEEAGLAALKMVGGLAAGGLGAVVRHAPRRETDPFAAATAEEPEDAMPDAEPLPGWAVEPAADGTVGADGADGADGRAPVPAEVLDLLYRSGLDPVAFTGTQHEWTDSEVVVGVLRNAVPESTREAGFGGVGYLVDAVLADERVAGQAEHAVYRVRVGGWDRYRVDLVPTATSPSPRRRRRDRLPLTIACDGQRTFTVFEDEVRVGPASALDQGPHGALRQLLDGSWLLGCRLSGGEAVEVDGRTGYRVIATAGTGPTVRAPLSWTPLWWLPAVAVVDASSGRLLRLTRYREGKVATWLELRSVADGGSDDFTFTPPDGLPIVTKPDDGEGEGGDDGGEFAGPEGQSAWPSEDLRAALGDVKKRVDANVAAARGILKSFLGGGR